MATTTPNYGWTVPTSSDLVKDGATAIETLGDAIDASMNTALGTKKAGMVLLNTTSFSAVASQSINNVFTSTSDNYRILINITSVSTQLDFQMKLRVSGTDDSSANYSRGGVYNYINGTPTALASVGDTKWAVGFINSGTGSKNNFSIDMYRPNFAGATTASVLGGWNNNVTFAGFFSGFLHDVSTSYDGFTLLCNTGTITGIVSVYGYND